MHVIELQVLKQGTSQILPRSTLGVHIQEHIVEVCSAFRLPRSVQEAAKANIRSSSEKICLFHDTQEFLLVDLAIAITVSFIDHFLQLFVSHPLTKLLGHTLQVLEGDLSRLVIIEQTECLEDLVFWVTVKDLVRHHL